MSNKPATADVKPSQNAAPQVAPPRKKKLSLDISEIDVVLERKISP